MFKKSKSNTTSYGIVGIGRFGYALQGVSDSIVALIPVITLTTVIGIAIRMFKKYVKA